MPNDTDQNNNNPSPTPEAIPQTSPGQISSADAPPIPPGVTPVSDNASPRIGKEYQDPGYTNYTSAPQPNMPPDPSTLSNMPSSPSDPMPASTPTPPAGNPPVASPRKFPVKILLIVVGVVVLLLVLLLVVRMVLPMLSGNNQNGNTPINQTEIVWWGLWEDSQIVAPIINEYQEANPGIKITYVPQSKENYRERLASAIARGDGPDIFRFHNSWVPMFSEELAVVPETVMTQQQFSQIYYPVMTRNLLTQDGLVGIPLMYDGLALYINDEIFTTFGNTPPTTWNEFELLAEEMTVRDENGIITQAGAAIGTVENVDHWQEILGLIMIQNGVNPNEVEQLASESAAQALQFYTDFVNENEVWDETQPNSTVGFAAGKVAMYFAPSWRAFEISQQSPDLEFRVIPVPQIPSADETSPDMTYATYWVEGVSEDSSEKDEAWKFLRYLSEADTLQKFYQSASQVRTFGEPYPRQDMRNLLLNAPIVGGVLQNAPEAQSWYLASRTWDGETGINTRISQYFEDAVNGMLGRSSGNPENLMQTVAAGVLDVFVQYRLATPAPAPER